MVLSIPSLPVDRSLYVQYIVLLDKHILARIGINCIPYCISLCTKHKYAYHDDEMIISTENMLNSRFDMKDMGPSDVILGIKIIRISYGLILSRSHYVDNILRKFGRDNSGIGRTLVDATLHLSKNK